MKPLCAAVAACLVASVAHAQDTAKPLFEGVRAGVGSTETIHPAPAPATRPAPVRDLPATVTPAIPSTPVAAPPAKPKPAPLTEAGEPTPELRAQILLERAWFSPGELDGEWGGKSRRALAAFQQAQGVEGKG